MGPGKLRCTFKIPWVRDASPHCVLGFSALHRQAHKRFFQRYKQGGIFVTDSCRVDLHQSMGLTYFESKESCEGNCADMFDAKIVLFIYLFKIWKI